MRHQSNSFTLINPIILLLYYENISILLKKKLFSPYKNKHIMEKPEKSPTTVCLSKISLIFLLVISRPVLAFGFVFLNWKIVVKILFSKSENILVIVNRSWVTNGGERC